jgi:hypothetical protein
LADPFFQPLAGHFGVLADIGWAQNTYDFEIPMGAGAWGGFSGAWDASEFFGKADLSVGITDDIAIIGGLKYGNSKYQMDWNPVTYNATYYPATTDKDKDSGIQSWGLGGQWKFWDDDEWISHIGAYYQNSDAADTITPEVRVGYKLDGGSKIYGLARASFISWADSAYGNAITNDDGQVAFITFERDVSTSVYFEGAIGWFHKFNDQWSMNAEGLLGHYGWHTQFMPKLAFYWQPSDHFALGVYGKTSLWDNANSYEDAYLYSWGPYDLDGVDGISSWEISDPACKGRVEMNKFKDTQIGINLMLYF